MGASRIVATLFIGAGVLTGCAAETTTATGQTGALLAPPANAPSAVETPDGSCAAIAEDAAAERDRNLWHAAEFALRYLRDTTPYSKISTPCFVWASKESVASKPAPAVPEGFDSQRNVRTAVYHCGTNTIYLREDIGAGRLLHHPYGTSILVHELTHHGQCQGGMMATVTRCNLEHEAYFIQADFLRYMLQRTSLPRDREFLERAAMNTLDTARQICPPGK